MRARGPAVAGEVWGVPDVGLWSRCRKWEGVAAPGPRPQPRRGEVVVGRGSPAHRDWTTKEEERGEEK